MSKVFNRAIVLGGEVQSIGGNLVKVLEFDVNGDVLKATGTTVPTADSRGFSKGCIFVDTDAADGVKGVYENIGTTTASDFNLLGDVAASEITLAEGNVLVGNSSGVATALNAKGDTKVLVGNGTTITSVALSGDVTMANTGAVTIANSAVETGMIADGAVTYAKRSVIGAATATADGLTTGLINAGETFVTVTSDSATKLITLPACAAAGIGQTIDLYVGATGYELVTPASSGDTINTVDSDGTNQLDVAADSLVHLIQVSATGWFAYNHAATTITVVAPDND